MLGGRRYYAGEVSQMRNRRQTQTLKQIYYFIRSPGSPSTSWRLVARKGDSLPLIVAGKGYICADYMST